ncbi:DNA-dependent ATPase protein rad54 [Apophysomyces ossiformis]|uniref:DNA-dependent ATPase protein rad54 n=1 Tax=Apophysomyces ossiformis TaxID=679940 RepID=A0A8H7ETK2_9FUNG|nr:DNA-dependent ATPase protein rad54 [Apophysomyces ossiformis]
MLLKRPKSLQGQITAPPQPSKRKRTAVASYKVDDLGNEDDDSDFEDKENVKRQALAPLSNSSRCFTPLIRRSKDYDPLAVLSKKFQVPSLKQDADQSSSSLFGPRRTLGLRRKPATARALYDHTADDALILWDPDVDKEQEESEKKEQEEPKKDTTKRKEKSLADILGLKKAEKKLTHVVVDPILAKILRPHQVEGVKFLFRCTTGKVDPNAFGCIMADEMGLGKTLQCISLVWTLLRQSGELGKPTINKAIITCPSSLVRNWANEIVKWLGESRVRPLVIDNAGSKEKISAIKRWAAAQGQIVNPGLLGTPNEFRKNYENPILRGRDADASEKERQISDEKVAEFWAIVSKFTIRRTNDILTKYLPTKYEHVVFCKLAPLQQALYQLFLTSPEIKTLLRGQGSQPLKAITMLKKLCNHPNLLDLPNELEGSAELLPTEYHSNSKSGTVNTSYSGKFMVLARMLAKIKRETKDKIVVVSNYTQTLDLFEGYCKQKQYGVLRLDGSMNIQKRQKLVDRFNDPEGEEFVFLLSSKAGGCGLNLIGANRLVLFDPDWNPAADQQALARVWRDGQRKDCFIYRFIGAGTIEEKIFQRQSHKQSLSNCVVDEATDTERHFSLADMRQLFQLNMDSECETHDTFKCKRCIQGKQHKAAESMQYGDTSTWDHYDKSLLRLPDPILQEESNKGIVSYVFQYISHMK